MDNPIGKRCAQVLLVDDDPAMHGLVSYMLKRHGYEVTSVSTMRQVVELASGRVEQAGAANGAGRMEAILLDRSLDAGEEDGLRLLPQIARLFPHVPVVLLTASTTTESVVEAMRRGAFDFLSKPVEEPRLVATVAKATEHHRLLRRVAGLDCDAPDGDCFQGIIGASPAMRAVFQTLRHVGPTDATVMITGESGTGKELIAQAVHRLSARAGGPFVPLNMAALPRELVEATLFGHEKGAFTGADKAREGAVGQAQGGTLFLDEIGEMPLELQAKLLRFLQERVYRPVGATSDVQADVRIVSATNRDPMAEVEAGRLRADLYYRLAVVPVQLPPLRHRPGDVELIAGFAMRRFSERYGKKFESIAPEALQHLAGCSWPGNVRELMHLMERMVVLNQGPVLRAEMLPPEVAGSGLALAKRRESPQSEPSHQAEGGKSLAEGLPFSQEIVPLSDLERRAVEHALRVCNGSAQAAAQKLGMSTATIYRKIKEWGLGHRAAG